MLALPLALPWLGAVGFAALDGRRRAVGWAAFETSTIPATTRNRSGLSRR